MLKNKTEVTQRLKYNGKIVEIEAGNTIDIRDFDVSNKDVKSAEKHIMTKYPGVFDQKDSLGDPERDKLFNKEMDSLKESIKILKSEKQDLLSANKELSQKNSATAGEIESLKKTIESLRFENQEIKAKFDDQEDEIKRLRESISSGKKKGK